MVKCSSDGCNSATHNKSPGLSFFRFPKDENLRNAWLLKMKRHDWLPRYNSVLCSKHFEDHLIDLGSSRCRLRCKAIPTLFDLPLAPREKENVSSEPGTKLQRKQTASGKAVTVLRQVENRVVASTSKQEVNVPHKEITALEPPSAFEKAVSVLQVENNVLPVASTSTEEVNVPRHSYFQKVTALKPPPSSKNEVISLKKRLLSKNKKLKALRQQRTRLKRKVSQFSDVISELKNKINSDDVHILKSIPGNNKDFLVRYINKAQGSILQKSYSQELRSFALQLHFYSPRAYNFVRNTFNTILPHPKTITRWYKKINAEPGFTSESFDTLEKLSKSSDHKIYVNLCVDEMAIRKGLVWDRTENKYKGYVDTGTEVSDDSFPLATQALVLLVTAINASWKLPIAYFFIVSMTGDQRARFVLAAIELLYNINIHVCGLTFDGAASNISMASKLGCIFDLESLQPYFTFKDLQINAFYDPCHMIKLVRNTLGDYKCLIDGDGNAINFDYITLLHDIQQEKGLHLANKLKQAHIYFNKQKMKVRLATQLLSRSVADALLYCKDNLKIDIFQDCSATVEFIKKINDAFDILNSRCTFVPGFKKALCVSNINLCIDFFQKLKVYLCNLKLLDGRLVVESGRKTGFTGFIISLKSAINLYNHLILKEKFRYLPLYKVSQDHLEMFFGLMRARGGYNDNPNVVQFRTAYKKNVTLSELKLHAEGRLVELPILSVSSSASVIDAVNSSTPTFEKNIMDVHDVDEDLILLFLDDVINTPLDEYTKDVIVYVAGFIARKVKKNIKCMSCQLLVMGEKGSLFSSLITLKDRGGLTYPSKALIKIIEVCEKCFKINKSNDFNSLMKFVSSYVDSSVFNLSNLHHDASHEHLLMKLVLKYYIDLRCKHASKESNLTYRNYLKKIVLFQNK